MIQSSDGLVGQLGECHRVKRNAASISLQIDDFRDDPDYVDPDLELEWLNAQEEAELDLKDVAACAIDTMPDISCSAIAQALGLKLHVVIGMSNGRHNKAKRRGVSKGIELAEVTKEELIDNYRSQNACGY